MRAERPRRLCLQDDREKVLLYLEQAVQHWLHTDDGHAWPWGGLDFTSILAVVASQTMYVPLTHHAHVTRVEAIAIRVEVMVLTLPHYTHALL